MTIPEKICDASLKLSHEKQWSNSLLKKHDLN